MDFFVSFILWSIFFVAFAGLVGWVWSMLQPYPEEWPTEVLEEFEDDIEEDKDTRI